jgi:hypothetical protein
MDTHERLAPPPLARFQCHRQQPVSGAPPSLNRLSLCDLAFITYSIVKDENFDICIHTRDYEEGDETYYTILVGILARARATYVQPKSRPDLASTHVNFRFAIADLGVLRDYSLQKMIRETISQAYSALSEITMISTTATGYSEATEKISYAISFVSDMRRHVTEYNDIYRFCQKKKIRWYLGDRITKSVKAAIRRGKQSLLDLVIVDFTSTSMPPLNFSLPLYHPRRIRQFSIQKKADRQSVLSALDFYTHRLPFIKNKKTFLVSDAQQPDDCDKWILSVAIPPAALDSIRQYVPMWLHYTQLLPQKRLMTTELFHNFAHAISDANFAGLISCVESILYLVGGNGSLSLNYGVRWDARLCTRSATMAAPSIDDVYSMYTSNMHKNYIMHVATLPIYLDLFDAAKAVHLVYMKKNSFVGSISESLLEGIGKRNATCDLDYLKNRSFFRPCVHTVYGGITSFLQTGSPHYIPVKIIMEMIRRFRTNLSNNIKYPVQKIFLAEMERFISFVVEYQAKQEDTATPPEFFFDWDESSKHLECPAPVVKIYEKDCISSFISKNGAQRRKTVHCGADDLYHQMFRKLPLLVEIVPIPLNIVTTGVGERKRKREEEKDNGEEREEGEEKRTGRDTNEKSTGDHVYILVPSFLEMLYNGSFDYITHVGKIMGADFSYTKISTLHGEIYHNPLIMIYYPLIAMVAQTETEAFEFFASVRTPENFGLLPQISPVEMMPQYFECTDDNNVENDMGSTRTQTVETSQIVPTNETPPRYMYEIDQMTNTSDDFTIVAQNVVQSMCPHHVPSYACNTAHKSEFAQGRRSSLESFYEFLTVAEYLSHFQPNHRGVEIHVTEQQQQQQQEGDATNSPPSSSISQYLSCFMESRIAPYYLFMHYPPGHPLWTETMFSDDPFLIFPLFTDIDTKDSLLCNEGTEPLATPMTSGSACELCTSSDLFVYTLSVPREHPPKK